MTSILQLLLPIGMPQDAKKALSSLLSISRAIAGPLDYELVLQNFGTELKKLIPYDHLDIVLLHPKGSQVCYEFGIHTSWSGNSHVEKPTETSPIRDVLLGNRDFLLTDDAWEDDRFHFDGADSQPIYDANLRSRIIVPQRVRGQIIGTLAISSHSIGAYDANLVEKAQWASDLLAPYLFALERGRVAREAAVAESEARGREQALRLGVQRLTEGIEQERQRLGMDIHDQTLADLARLSRRISRQRKNASIDPDEIASIGDDLEICLDELRAIVEDMKPVVLQLFGFAAAVEAHLDRCTAGRGAALETEVVDGSDGLVDSLPDSIRTSLYRIVQEATNNAIRHADPTYLKVGVFRSDGSLTICVEDNGPGIADGDLQSMSGISNIRTRASLISASSTIGRRQDQPGTIVTINMPVKITVAEIELDRHVYDEIGATVADQAGHDQ